MYYYNKVTKVSSWQRPIELDQPVESPKNIITKQNETKNNDISISNTILPNGTVAATSMAPKIAASCPWKEYLANDGTNRKYYYNAEAKKSVWEMPLEYKGKILKFIFELIVTFS